MGVVKTFLLPSYGFSFGYKRKGVSFAEVTEARRKNLCTEREPQLSPPKAGCPHPSRYGAKAQHRATFPKGKAKTAPPQGTESPSVMKFLKLNLYEKPAPHGGEPAAGGGDNQFLWFHDLRAPERRSVRRFLYSSGFATMSPERFSAHLVSVGPISS